MLTFDKLHEMVEDSLVKIFSSQMGVSASGDHFEHSVVNSQNRDIESSSSQIEYQNILLSLFLI